MDNQPTNDIQPVTPTPFTEPRRSGNRIGLALGAFGLLVAGVIVGMLVSGAFAHRAFAATNTTEDQQSETHRNGPAFAGKGADLKPYCTTFVTNLAKELNTTTDKLQTATKAALKDTVEQAVTDKKITRTQADTIEKQIDAQTGDICTSLGSFKGGMGDAGKFGQALHGVHDAVVSAVAAKLGEDATTLENDLHSGKAILDLASAKGVSKDTLNSTIIATITSQLKTLVSNNTITQAQSDQALTFATNAVNNGDYGVVGLGGHKH